MGAAELLPRVAGHKVGAQTTRTMIETCARLNIEALTLYAFSVENWRRPKTETDFLMQLLREYLRTEMPLIQRNNIRMRVFGTVERIADWRAAGHEGCGRKDGG